MKKTEPKRDDSKLRQLQRDSETRLKLEKQHARVLPPYVQTAAKGEKK